MSRNVITSEHLRILRTSKHFQGLSEFTSKKLFLVPLSRKYNPTFGPTDQSKSKNTKDPNWSCKNSSKPVKLC